MNGPKNTLKRMKLIYVSTHVSVVNQVLSPCQGIQKVYLNINFTLKWNIFQNKLNETYILQYSYNTSGVCKACLKSVKGFQKYTGRV
jgi:hypothetical protein